MRTPGHGPPPRAEPARMDRHASVTALAGDPYAVAADTGRPGGLRLTLAVVTCGSELGVDMMGFVLGASSRCDTTGVGWAMCREPLFARTGTVI